MAVSKNAGPDLGVVGGGDWLYRQQELVLGPINARLVVEKLYSGELTGKSEITPLGQQQFRRIAEIDFFKLHLAKAEAKLRVEAAAAAEQLKSARKRNVRIGIVATIALLVAVGAASAARYFAVHNPFKATEEDEITVEPPTVALARTHRGDEDLVEYPGGEAPKSHGSEPIARSSGSSGSSRSSGGSHVSRASEDIEGMQTAKFDKSGINAVVASKQRTLYPCFSEEGKRNPGFSAQIPIEFVIGNDGKVNKLWVDNPTYKTGPLADCLLRELQKWAFRPYEGEQATVGLSFRIGKGS